jgi:RHS repeat-associated protein
MSETWASSAGNFDLQMVAIKAASSSAQSSVASSTYTYAGTGYANPHAATQIATGLSTTTFVYDNDGNVTQKTTDGITTTYVYDYANRLTALGVSGATTTYGYDAFGSRVYQIVATTSTTTYPFKFFSVASTTKSSTNWATSTEYAFNGDTLLATVDQQFKNGVATGSAQTRYVHPDHLGSTNVVTNESGALVQTLDYYPYGATRISNSTSTNEKRKFIGQFLDDSGLSYLNARYYDAARGQFISQDPSFLAVGDPIKLKQVTGRDQQQFLSDPQLANSSNYGRDNPITQKDPDGNATYMFENGGGMTGRDTWNTNTYYEAGDRAILQQNAQLMSNNQLNVPLFVGLVKPNGAWDYKTQSRSLYIVNGKVVDKEAFGNINYGYTGTAGGFGPDILKDAGGFVQTYTGRPYPSVLTNYDQPWDRAAIQKGISLYRSTNFAATSQATQYAYTVQGGQISSRALNTLYVALQGALKTLQGLINSKPN